MNTIPLTSLHRLGGIGTLDGVTRAPEPPTDAELRVEREMKREKRLEDVESFGEFVCMVGMAPNEREFSQYFGVISTRDLIAEVMFSPRAKDEQIAEAVREVMRRYLAEEGLA